MLFEAFKFCVKISGPKYDLEGAGCWTFCSVLSLSLFCYRLSCHTVGTLLA